MDKRDVTTTHGMYQAMIEHVKTTFNGGVIKPAITIFRQRKKGEHDLRVWNPLFLMHAGYSFEVAPDEDNIGEEREIKKIGDQINLDFTRVNRCSTIFSHFFTVKNVMQPLVKNH